LLLAASVAAQPAAPAASKKPVPKTSTAAKPATGAAAKTTVTVPATGNAAASAGTTTPAPADDAAAGGPATAEPGVPAAATDLAAVKPEDMPTAVRMRRLEQKTQALKERAWQLKARVQMLKEQMIGGGVGAQVVIEHSNDMGASFRLTKLIYALDGTQVFVRTDDTAENLYKAKGFDVFAGPIAPGNHSLAAVATYRGHGYGVFEYLSKYTFTAKGGQAFIAGEGKIAKVDCRGFEKGGATTPLEKRSAIECKVTQVQPDKPADKSGDTTAGKPLAPGAVPASTPPGPPVSSVPAAASNGTAQSGK
jgi:hypothetical protein